MMPVIGLLRTRGRHAALILAAAGACTSGEREERGDTAGPRDATAASSTAALDSATRRIIAFLQGNAPLPDSLLADSVTLYVAPEGGGARLTLPRAALRDPERWTVQSDRVPFRFAPSGTSTRLTTRAGVHFNCQEQTLASRFPELATHPHVGAKLEPNDASSCLQAWNVTFVFDAATRRLIAAVYDQFEW